MMDYTGYFSQQSPIVSISDTNPMNTFNLGFAATAAAVTNPTGPSVPGGGSYSNPNANLYAHYNSYGHLTAANAR